MASRKKRRPGASFEKRVVIDASIAYAAGSASQALSPTSKHCRDVLIALRKSGHLMILTQEIEAEWKKHESSFAREWRISMLQKNTFLLPNAVNQELRGKIGGASATQREIKAMLKDMLLIEAALPTDKVIIARDENQDLPLQKFRIQ